MKGCWNLSAMVPFGQRRHSRLSTLHPHNDYSVKHENNTQSNCPTPRLCFVRCPTFLYHLGQAVSDQNTAKENLWFESQA